MTSTAGTREGVVAAWAADNVDTDLIIPMEPLLSVPRAELGRHAFRAVRYAPGGTPNPDFVLNQARFAGASILVAGRNFGCGSSREGAVHALAGMGFDVVVASSFGDIFLGNCVKNSVVPLQVAAADLQHLHDAVAATPTPVRGSLDLATMELTVGPVRVPGHLDPALRERLDGGDEIDLTLRHAARIAAFQARDRVARPWIWQSH